MKCSIPPLNFTVKLKELDDEATLRQASGMGNVIDLARKKLEKACAKIKRLNELLEFNFYNNFTFAALAFSPSHVGIADVVNLIILKHLSFHEPIHDMFK